MHVHLPKPLHGWREFAGEVGIIVIGVVIALAGEQLIETLHWRHVVTDYRAALRSEIAHNLGTYRYRMQEDRCVDATLNELDAWLQSWRAGHKLALGRPIGVPSSLMVFTGVWASRSAEIESHMPLSEQLAYSRLYDRFGNNEVHRLAERSVWISFQDYNAATDLSHENLMRLQGLIDQARYRESAFDANALAYARQASELGINARSETSWPPLTNELCRPLLRPSNNLGRSAVD